MAVKIKLNSYLRFSDLITVDGIELWDVCILPDEKILTPRTGDIDYKVKGTDRIDLLAFKHYGDPVLWWVIAVGNQMEDLPTDLAEGVTIRIPDPKYVKEQLFAVSTRSS